IDADGALLHDGEVVTLAEFRDEVRRSEAPLVKLKIDRSASSQVVSDVMHGLKAPGMPQIRFIMDAVTDLPAAEAEDDVSDAGGIPTGWQAFSEGRLRSLLQDQKPVLVN